MIPLVANAERHRDEFPRLARAVDPQWLAPALESWWGNEYPDRRIRVDEVAIERVNVSPGEDVRVLYRVQGRDPRGAFDQWFHGRMRPGEERSPGRTPHAPGTNGTDSFCPVAFWPELQISLAAFPHDKKLGSLAAIVDPDNVRAVADRHRMALGLDAAWSCRHADVHRVKYRPGKHCVVRYTLEFRDSDEAMRRLDVYCKASGGRRGDRVFDALSSIARALGGREHAFEVPKPLVRLEAEGAFWQEAWEGQKLSALDPGYAWIHRAESDLLPRIASGLAELHRIEGIGLAIGPAPDADALVAAGRGDAATIARFLPRRARALEQIIDVLEAGLTVADSNAPTTLVHGTFKIAQVLVRGDRLALVDFDSVGVGDPLHDVAEFAASLLYLAFSHGIASTAVWDGLDRFVNAYEQRVQWRCDRRRIWWYTALFLLGKIHASLKTLECATDEQVEPAFALLQHLAAGAHAERGTA
jgi:aminoglycoside phosphotransferase (APT) family kinase protein